VTVLDSQRLFDGVLVGAVDLSRNAPVELHPAGSDPEAPCGHVFHTNDHLHEG
jgi:hypothetical protein